LAAFQLWKLLNHNQIAQVITDTLQQCHAQLLVGNFATAKTQGHFALVTIGQKSADVAHLDVVVTVIGTRSEFNFLDFNDRLLGFCFGSTLLFLVFEIAATATPPVCRLMDYGKFKYQEQKRAAEAKAKQTVIEIKEIKFRPGTDDGDYNIKMRNIRRFLADGDKCKVTLRFRGREITHQELGMALLQRIRDDLGDLIVVEQFPKLEGRQMIMMIAPGRKKPAGKTANEAAPAASE